jgi:hypothetical protein
MAYTFLTLPPEIRNMIYCLLLIKPHPILICSPRRKHVVNQELTSENFGCLLRINKQVNIEASTIFYSKNQFVVGNGSWASKKFANVHALKAFLSRVPRKYIAHITNVVVEVHCRKDCTNGPIFVFPRIPELLLGTAHEASNLLTISRALVRHFKGLEILTYQKLDSGEDIYMPFPRLPSPKLSTSEAIAELQKSLLVVLRHTNLKEIRTFDDKLVDMQTAVEKILSKNPKAGEILRKNYDQLEKSIEKISEK